MVKVTLIEADGGAHHLDLPEGSSLRDGATDHGISGILGDCGGLCACSTCHVYVDPAWRAACGEPDELEAAMLELAMDPKDNSRLSCQIRLTAELDGLVVQIPERQF